MGDQVAAGRSTSSVPYWLYSIVVVPVLIDLILGSWYWFNSDDLEIGGAARVLLLVAWPVLSAVGTAMIVRVAGARMHSSIRQDYALSFFLILTLTVGYAPVVGMLFMVVFPGSDEFMVD